MLPFLSVIYTFLTNLSCQMLYMSNCKDVYLKHTDVYSLVVILLELISLVSVGEQFHSWCYAGRHLYPF